MTGQIGNKLLIRPAKGGINGTNEEKEKIVLLYLNHQMGVGQIVREFKLYGDQALYRWVKIYKKYD